ncbi:tetratricopeptide repeat-containing sensor histidine kinase [Sunxiuqinia sp. sy24]|uniref:tetratricopeptide repeat-containing sensor histidine kinase n=1 Tax=Sunxiuqinia sp. sy24 TaxID=3461495 RepID=UPI004045CA7F
MMPNQCFLFLLLVLSLTDTYGQILNTKQADTTEINHLLDKLDELTKRNLDSALLLGQEVFQKATAIHYRQGIWETQLNQGKAYYLAGKKDTAYAILNQLLNQTRKQANRITEIKTHIQLANNFQNNYNFKLAIEHLIAAQKLLTNTDTIDLHFNILNSLGMVHRKMKNYDLALSYFNQLEENFFFQLTPIQRFRLYTNQGNVYAVQRDYDKTEALYSKAYHEIQKINHPAHLASITYNLGALYYRQKRYQQAEEHITQSLKASFKIGDQTQIELCYRVLGAIQMDQDQYSKAETYFLKALEIAKAIDHKKSILGNYKNLYLNYWGRGYETQSAEDLDKALNYMDLFRQLNDTIYQLETTEKILELEKQYETEKKNTQITLLEQDNQLKEDELYIQRTQQTYLFIVILLVSGILAIFIYFYYYYRKVNRLLQLQGKRILNQRNQISDQNEKLQKSIDTQNKLFGIIAHDLRSPLVSIANVAKLIGFYLEDKRYDDLEAVAQMMEQKNDQVLELTDNLLNWAKSQSEGLSPFFEKVSFHEIVEECFDLYHPIAQSKTIRLIYDEAEDLKVWTDRNMLKTICRNLINNAIKFTPRGGKIQVDYYAKGNLAKLCVQDSGVGIPPEKLAILFQVNRAKVTPGTDGEKSSGLGLTVCKEFATALNGEIKAESSEGKGSRFCLTLALFNSAIHQPKVTARKLRMKPSVN